MDLSMPEIAPLSNRAFRAQHSSTFPKAGSVCEAGFFVWGVTASGLGGGETISPVLNADDAFPLLEFLAHQAQIPEVCFEAGIKKHTEQRNASKDPVDEKIDTHPDHYAHRHLQAAGSKKDIKTGEQHNRIPEPRNDSDHCIPSETK